MEKNERERRSKRSPYNMASYGEMCERERRMGTVCAHRPMTPHYLVSGVSVIVTTLVKDVAALIRHDYAFIFGAIGCKKWRLNRFGLFVGLSMFALVMHVGISADCVIISSVLFSVQLLFPLFLATGPAVSLHDG